MYACTEFLKKRIALIELLVGILLKIQLKAIQPVAEDFVMVEYLNLDIFTW